MVVVIVGGRPAGGLRRIGTVDVSRSTTSKRISHLTSYPPPPPNGNQIKSNLRIYFSYKLTRIDPLLSHLIFPGPRSKVR